MNYNKRNTLTTARTIPTRLLSDACKEDAVLAKVGRESIRCNWGGHHVLENGLSMMEAADRLRQVADRLERMHDGGFRMESDLSHLEFGDAFLGIVYHAPKAHLTAAKKLFRSPRARSRRGGPAGEVDDEQENCPPPKRPSLTFSKKAPTKAPEKTKCKGAAKWGRGGAKSKARARGAARGTREVRGSMRTSARTGTRRR
mmetsp:Transcript_97705/g.279430  ORF Transcript_97705/g.279430 Transcript_97705/m.279430 type:complete len:200 (-) Transcript_97705:388-987(-)